METIEYLFAVEPSLDLEPTFFAGMECEIESVCNTSNVSGFWKITDDASLRNDGREFISPPTTIPELVCEFAKLHKTLVCGGSYPKFSERTSIHVHVNCLHLSPQQVKNIVLLYALLEEFFFLACDPSRKNNIYCVPLSDTYLPSIYRFPLKDLWHRWHKYTALNIRPLSQHGTIEFRHMQGTDDVGLVTNWLTALGKLWDIGRDIDIKKNLSLDVLSETADYIFKQFPEWEQWKMSMNTLTWNQRQDARLSLIGGK